ncbi:MAG: hypothetical protein OXC02_03070 [Rhodobacteraceae bacterium]|nr:hypothetical protein [Paracoccaceae bacterium]
MQYTSLGGHTEQDIMELWNVLMLIMVNPNRTNETNQLMIFCLRSNGSA